MGKIRRSRHSRLLLLAALACACGGAARGAGGPTSGSASGDRAAQGGDDEGRAIERHPDGVVLDPPPALPSATARAEARGVIALREPRGDQEVQRLVRSLIDGFEHESIEEVMRLFAADAGPIGGRYHASREMLARELQMRMGRVDYAQLAGLQVYRPDRIQRFEYDELGGDGEVARPTEMRPGDVLVKVPIELARLNGERFFPDVLTLLLRAGDDGRFKVEGWGEADNP